MQKIWDRNIIVNQRGRPGIIPLPVSGVAQEPETFEGSTSNSLHADNLHQGRITQRNKLIYCANLNLNGHLYFNRFPKCNHI